jgi:ribonuclease P protein component
LNRSLRITSSNDFKRVRRDGKSYAHPLAVVLVTESQSEHSRVGFITGKSVGNAVQRNRARRRLRAILSGLIINTKKTVDIVVIGRSAISSATYWELRSAIVELLVRAGILEKNVSN